MRKVRKKSPVPVYGLAGVCLLYCLIFPLYRLWHFIILIAAMAASYVILSKLFPGTVETVKEPKPEPEPVTTGNPEHDALLRQGEQAVKEMGKIMQSVKDPGVRGKIIRIIELTDKIFKDIVTDPGDYKAVKRFANYFLPTTLKLLYTYDRMAAIDIRGENIDATKGNILNALDATITAFEKQYDALFANQALDIETDITVFEAMLKKEGLK